VFSVVTWTAFGLAVASQATAFDDEVRDDCATLAATANEATPETPRVVEIVWFPVTAKVEPSKVKFDSPIIALAPVTVVIVLLVDPDKLVPEPSAPDN